MKRYRVSVRKTRPRTIKPHPSTKPSTLLAAAAMSAFALSKADRVAELASNLSTAAVGGLRIRMSRFNILRKETCGGQEKQRQGFSWQERAALMLECIQKRLRSRTSCGVCKGHGLEGSNNPHRVRTRPRGKFAARSSSRRPRRWNDGFTPDKNEGFANHTHIKREEYKE